MESGVREGAMREACPLTAGTSRPRSFSTLPASPADALKPGPRSQAGLLHPGRLDREMEYKQGQEERELTGAEQGAFSVPSSHLKPAPSQGRRSNPYFTNGKQLA